MPLTQSPNLGMRPHLPLLVLQPLGDRPFGPLELLIELEAQLPEAFEQVDLYLFQDGF